MKPGPKPQPTAIKLANGNPGHRPLNDAEPRAEIGAPHPPDWLAPLARAKWEEVVPELVRMGVLALIDGATLAAYCSCYARWVEAEKVIAIQGTTYATTGRQGKMLRQRPEVQIAAEALRQMRAYAAEFGLTPSARTRLRGTPGQGDLFDPTDDKYFN